MVVTRRAAIAGGALSLTMPGLFRTAQAQGTKAGVTFGPAIPLYALSMVAIEKGYAKEEGVDLALLPTEAGAQSRQALAAGDALFAHGDASHPLQLTAGGRGAKMLLATQMVASIANVVVRKDLFDKGINSIEALGQWTRPGGAKPVVAATAIGSGTWMFGTFVFEARGLRDRMSWVAGGGSKTMLAGLQSRQFDAIMATPSWQIEAEQGRFGATIYDVRVPGVWVRDFGGTLPVLVLYTLADTIARQSDLVQAFVNAMYRSMLWIKSVPVDDVSALIGEKYYNGLYQAAVKAELSFDTETWPYSGVISKPDFDRGGRVWYRNGTGIPPTDYTTAVDMRFLEAARKKFG